MAESLGELPPERVRYAEQAVSPRRPNVPFNDLHQIPPEWDFCSIIPPAIIATGSNLRILDLQRGKTLDHCASLQLIVPTPPWRLRLRAPAHCLAVVNFSFFSPHVGGLPGPFPARGILLIRSRFLELSKYDFPLLNYF